MQYYIEVEPNVKLFIEDIGSGVPVVFIHGWPLNHSIFEYQVTQLPKYGFRCISIDLRGFGKSDQPWTGYDYDRMADDIRIVLDTLYLEQVRLIGFSMGGAIAIRYMSRHRGHRVAKLLLLGAAAPAFTQRDNYPYGMTKAEVDELIELTYTDRPQMVAAFGEKVFAQPVTPSFKDWFQFIGVAASNHGTVCGAISLREEDLRQDLPQVHAPTFIFHGVLDQICPFKFAILMHKGIHGSQLLRFEKSGHGIFYDELELFNQRLLSVL
ncbi:alpha/beta hydrolase [Paenibacillus sp. BR2-3]|uniref:alpha/beta fold hydrolase n=1 Tax=Paenibacillus sp. BR2-3 TaxID=3048494 RepID=UPI003977BD92